MTIPTDVTAAVELHAVGVFAFPDFDGRWYVGAEWHYDTDTDVPTRIVMVRADQYPINDVESRFNDAGGYGSEAAAIAAINNMEIS
jgi:hypothetical protein